MSNLRIGTSGWHYPDGKGTWNGIFYPPVGKRPRGFDELSFYAEHFDTVEVNSTFYGQPRANVTGKWADRTPEGFEFSIKLYQKFTHPKMFRKRLEEAIPEGDRTAIEELSRPNLADLDEFKRINDSSGHAAPQAAVVDAVRDEKGMGRVQQRPHRPCAGEQIQSVRRERDALGSWRLDRRDRGSAVAGWRERNQQVLPRAGVEDDRGLDWLVSWKGGLDPIGSRRQDQHRRSPVGCLVRCDIGEEVLL